MLSMMRKQKESIVIKIVFVIIVLSFIGTIFLVWGRGSDGMGGGRNSYAAKVDGTRISLEEYQNAYQRIRNMYQQIYGQSIPPEMEKMLGLKKVALDSLIDSLLAMKEAKSLGIKVSKEEVSASIEAMPMFQKDVLHCGPLGLGFLRAAMFAGALAMSFFMAHRPPMQKPGRIMLACVGGFGLCMLGFAASRNLCLSLLALMAAGMLDQVSVLVRQTLVQVRTPETLRGRVQAVNFLFIGSSNELGEVESGLSAGLLGPVGSVVLGGVAVLVVVSIWAIRFPALRDLPGLGPREKSP